MWRVSAGLCEPGGVTGGVLAHQGGWDEVLFVAVPILVFGLLLVVANRRAARLPKQDDTRQATESTRLDTQRDNER